MLDLIIQGGTLVDGSGAPRRRADVASATDGSSPSADRRNGGTRHRCRRSCGRARLHRSPHPLRRAGSLGSHAQSVIPPRGDDRDRRQLRVHACADRARAHRLHHPDALARRGDAAREPACRGSLRLENLRGLPGTASTAASGFNVGFLVGHSTIRRWSWETTPSDIEATPEQIDAMSQLLAESISQGGLGFSSSIGGAHFDGDGNPIPSRAATHDELITLASVAGEHTGTTSSSSLPRAV